MPDYECNCPVVPRDFDRLMLEFSLAQTTSFGARTGVCVLITLKFPFMIPGRFGHNSILKKVAQTVSA